MTQANAPASAARRRQGPSQADVARLVGVSGQTVSRVANGLDNVTAVTRDRVLAAMEELGYRPNSAAIAAAAGSSGYSVNLLPVPHPTQAAVSSAFGLLDEQAVDGVIILIAARHLGDTDVVLPDGLPVVVIDSSGRYDYPIVDNDHAQGARLATEHLLDLGHETVWHIAGPPSSFAATRRQASWRETLLERGRAVPPVLVGDWSADSGYELGHQLAGDHRVTAVFAAADEMALGLLRALHERSRSVPDEVSVVGFNDTAEAAHYWPPLTTVRQSFAEVGRRSVEALIGEIRSGEHHHQPVYVPTELVIRRSTAPPPTTTS